MIYIICIVYPSDLQYYFFDILHRALDCLPATIDVLQSVVSASEGKLEVYMDGGIRTGLDVFKALAYGKKK